MFQFSHHKILPILIVNRDNYVYLEILCHWEKEKKRKEDNSNNKNRERSCLAKNYISRYH